MMVAAYEVEVQCARALAHNHIRDVAQLMSWHEDIVADGLRASQLVFFARYPLPGYVSRPVVLKEGVGDYESVIFTELYELRASRIVQLFATEHAHCRGRRCAPSAAADA
jgi:hypothetical protein